MGKKTVADRKEAWRKAKQVQEDVVEQNPFERIVVKRKREVLGQYAKAQEVRTGQARSQAHKQRESTLGVELNQLGKKNVFVDRRIGESDPNMTAEAKQLRRFQRQKLLDKKSIFHLSDNDTESARRDDDEDAGDAGDVLTHMGQALANLTSFDDLGPNHDDEDDDENVQELERRMVEQYHFGGGEGEGVRKTREEVMSEIIAKSKMYKAQRADEKDEQVKLTEKLDLQLPELTPLLQHRPTRASRTADDEEPDEFDKLVREMANDARSRVTDRLRTEDEIAKKEAERLQKLEEQRRRRMKDQAEKAAPASASSDLLSGSSKRRTEVSGDSLEDDFSFYAGQIEEDEIEDDVTSDTDTKGDTDFVSATTSSSASIIVADDYDDDDDDDDDDDHDDDHDSGTAASSTKQPTQKADAKHHPAREQTSATLSDVAFVLDVPESQQELADLVDTRSPSDMAIILSRILKSNHPSLGPAENHGKIERYSTLLFQQFAAVAASFVPFAIADHQFASLAAAATAKDALLRLDAIVTTLYQVASLAEDKVLAITKSKLRAMNQALDDAADAPDTSSCCWSTADILYLQLVTQLYPVSDFQHAITTPAMLLACRYVAQYHSLHATSAQLLVKLFLCQVLYNFVKPTQRYVPEAIGYLYELLSTAAHVHCGSALPPGTFSSAAIVAQLREWLTDDSSSKPKSKATSDTASSITLTVLLHGKTKQAKAFLASSAFKFDCIVGALALLRQFVGLYRNMACVDHVFAPFIPYLTALAANKTNTGLANAAKQTVSLLGAVFKSCQSVRQPLQLQKRKPVPLPSFEPLIEERVLNPNRPLPKESKKQQTKRLQQRVKRETKGAIRELKKDSYFIAEQQLQKRKRDVIEKQSKWGKIVSTLQHEQQHINDLEREKRRQRR